MKLDAQVYKYRKPTYIEGKYTDFLMKYYNELLPFLAILFAQCAQGAIRVEMELCTTATQANKILYDAQGIFQKNLFICNLILQFTKLSSNFSKFANDFLKHYKGKPNALFMRLGVHGRYKAMRNTYHYKSRDKITPYNIPGIQLFFMKILIFSMCIS